MEGFDAGEKSVLVAELTRVLEWAVQLEGAQDQGLPMEYCKALASSIRLSVDRSVQIARSWCLETPKPLSGSESPFSSNGSPGVELLEPAVKNTGGKEVSKKRKTQPKWTNRVQVTSVEDVSPLDDGHSWRKYGQKDILNSKYPRSYYRCTYQVSQGCQATRQVQRTDDNPLVFDVIYQGHHTCSKKARSTGKLSLGAERLQGSIQHSDQSLLNQISEGQSSGVEEQKTSFTFPSNMIGAENGTVNTSFMSSFSASFASPGASEANYFALSPCQMSNYGSGIGVPRADSELTEVISAATSATNSPMMTTGIDFMFEQLESEQIFSLDYF